jgi:hypothetical protein
MEYASGGELFERICNAGRFSEDEVLIQRFDFIDDGANFLIYVPFCCVAGTVLLPATYIRS